MLGTQNIVHWCNMTTFQQIQYGERTPFWK